MAERTALVTGGAGFIGRHLTEALAAAGRRVIVVDDFSRADTAGLPANARVVCADLTRPIAPHEVGAFDELYHLAAVVGVAQANSDPGRVLRTNILATHHTLALCREFGPAMIYLASTSEINDGAARVGVAAVPVPETAPFAIAEPHSPRSSYAVSKLASELAFLYAGDEMRTRVRIGRYHNVYGHDMGDRHVIPQFVQRIAERVDPFPIYGADQSRAFCHIDDAVRATLAITNHPAAEPIVANIGDDRREITARQLAELLFDIAGWHPTLDVHPPPAGSPDRRCPDLTHLRALTGFEPSVTLEDGLRHIVAQRAGASV